MPHLGGLNLIAIDGRSPGFCAGMLPELDAMARVLEMQEEWLQEALDMRSDMLGMLAAVAEAYIKAGRGSTSHTVPFSRRLQTGCVIH